MSAQVKTGAGARCSPSAVRSPAGGSALRSQVYRHLSPPPRRLPDAGAAGPISRPGRPATAAEREHGDRQPGCRRRLSPAIARPRPVTGAAGPRAPDLPQRGQPEHDRRRAPMTHGQHRERARHQAAPAGLAPTRPKQITSERDQDRGDAGDQRPDRHARGGRRHAEVADRERVPGTARPGSAGRRTSARRGAASGRPWLPTGTAHESGAAADRPTGRRTRLAGRRWHRRCRAAAAPAAGGRVRRRGRHVRAPLTAGSATARRRARIGAARTGRPPTARACPGRARDSGRRGSRRVPGTASPAPGSVRSRGCAVVGHDPALSRCSGRSPGRPERSPAGSRRSPGRPPAPSRRARGPSRPAARPGAARPPPVRKPPAAYASRRACRASSSATVAGTSPPTNGPVSSAIRPEREHRARLAGERTGSGSSGWRHAPGRCTPARPVASSARHPSCPLRRTATQRFGAAARTARPPRNRDAASGTTRSRSRPAAPPARWPARSRSRSRGTRSSSRPWPSPPRSAPPGCCGTC